VIKLYDYQLEIIEKAETTLLSKKECVIASCPSSGKTHMALAFAQRNPKKSFLILPHGTTIIKQQWLSRAEEFSIKNVKIELPQTLYNKDLTHYDYLMIDEAHEYTDAAMIQTIIKKVKPKKILYFTGTPSGFIRKGVPTHIIAAEKLIPEYISDLYFGLFSTSANLSDKAYTKDLEIKGSKEIKLVDSAKVDIQSLVKALIKRLKTTKFLKSKPLLSKSGFTVFGELGKTMIACNSIAQLTKIESALKEEGVSVISSHSKNDKDSLNMAKFEIDPSINVLLVVGRGILGFNMTDLVNVVDMTGSHNIDRIYQLYARVMRKSPTKPLKYFFKLTSTQDMQITKFYMNAAIHLMRYDFVSIWNGKNLNAMEVKVAKIARKRKKSKPGPGAVKPGPTSVAIDEFFSSVITANQILEDVWNKQDGVLNEYATMRIGQIKEKAFNIEDVRKIVNITEENLRYMIKTGKVDERIYG
jgi:superfamily II DNA or RNA helicase